MQSRIFRLLHDRSAGAETGCYLPHCWAKHQHIRHAAFIVDQHKHVLEQRFGKGSRCAIVPGVSAVNWRWRCSASANVIVLSNPGSDTSKLRCQGIVTRHLCLIGEKGSLYVTTKLTRSLHLHLVDEFIRASCRVNCTKTGTHTSMLVR